ncbi:hypothetical protein M378DRAFT_165162 [Amanita muscaria Koide BX008]|uniref:Uncharacterized protein n=1 Tax=Amanita muscaria (strain Koide BX008) TaxID=946122 RepID=A0A0C2X177_AMAMK|nr:hypothetical protein M378DRAFT_165162 [Amanita muscaria Koide BX008]
MAQLCRETKPGWETESPETPTPRPVFCTQPAFSSFGVMLPLKSRLISMNIFST